MSHGAPTLALDRVQGAELAAWARAMPAPRAILCVSAHWEATPVALGAVASRELIYDFGGFPDELYSLRYDAPGAPALAERVSELLGGVERRGARGWDHGVWVPLLHMAPAADVPVLQLSLPSRAPTRELVEIGRKLAPLRGEGVLVLASGGLVHNLRELDWNGSGPAPEWAVTFEEWARARLVARDIEAWIDFERGAPQARRAHPTFEHILPLLVALGASDDSDVVAFRRGGFEFGSLSRTAVQFG